MHTVNSPQHLLFQHLVFHVTPWDLLAQSGGVSQPSLHILHIPAEPLAWERAAPSDHRSWTHAGLLMTRLPAGERNIWSKNNLIYLLFKYELMWTYIHPLSYAFYELNGAKVVSNIHHKELFIWWCLRMSSSRGQRAHYSSCSSEAYQFC